MQLWIPAFWWMRLPGKYGELEDAKQKHNKAKPRHTRPSPCTMLVCSGTMHT
jgi:hypothetical protein